MKASIIIILVLLLAGCGTSSMEELAGEVQLGERMLDVGDYVKAEQAFERALKIDASHVKATYLRGKALEFNKQYAQAYAHYIRTYELSPGHMQAGESALRLELMGKHVQKAAERLEKLVNFGLNKVRQTFWQAKLAMARNDVRKAASLLSEIRTLDKVSDDVLMADAKAALALKAYARSQNDLDQILQRNDMHYEATLLSAMLDLAQGKTALAESHLKGMQLRLPNDETVIMRLAFVQMRQQKTDEAIKNYQYILTLPGSHDITALTLGEIFAAKQQTEALKQLTKAMKVSSRSGEGIRSYLNGLALLLSGEVEPAADLLRKSSLLLPSHAPVWVAYGQAVLAQGKHTHALLLFEKAVGLDSKMQLAQIQMARINFLRGEYFQAEVSLLDILKNRPCDTQAEIVLARVYMMKNDARHGLERIDKCLAGSGENWPVAKSNSFRAIRADLLFKLGQKRAALAILQALVAANPSHKTYQTTMVRTLMALGRTTEAKKMLEKLVEHQEVLPTVMLAMLYLGQGEKGLAESLLIKALEIDESSFMGNLQLGLMRLEQGKFPEAKRLLSQVLTQAPKDGLANQGFGVMAQSEGDLRAAEEYYTKALAAKGDFALSHMGMAEVMLATGRTYAAAEHAQAALVVAKDSARALMALGVAKQSSGEFIEANRVFNKLLRIYPKMSEGWVQRGKLMLKWDKNKKALASFQQALRVDPKHAVAIIGRVDAHLALGQQEIALRELELLLDDAKDDPFLLRMKGTLLLRTGQTKRAVEPLRHAYKLEPSSDMTVMLLAQVEAKLGDVAQALDQLQAHGDILLASAPVRVMYASLLEQVGKPGEAVKVYTKLLREQPKNASVLNNLAWALYQSGGDALLALNYARRASSIDSKSVQFMDTLGVLLLVNKNNAGALHVLQQAAKQRPEDLDIAFHSIQAMVENEKIDDALKGLAALLARQVDWDGLAEAEKLYHKLEASD